MCPQYHNFILLLVAVQCNLVGEPYSFITTEAPDPRDLLWANVICERRYIERRKLLVEFLLCVFVLLWGAFGEKLNSVLIHVLLNQTTHK